MSLLVNKEVRKILALLTLVLFVGMILVQISVYINAVHFKNEMVMHDYQLAGYLSQKYPAMELEIQAAFTANKLSHHLKKGKALLEQSGYKNNIQLYLIPQVNKFYMINRAISLTFSILLSIAILMVVYLFLKHHYRRIDRYNDDVNKIMNGEFTTKLDDHEEGSLSKLASSINMVTGSLYTHIQKEKQSRVFLKDIIANISHQLKTPLSALAMYNEIMNNENTDNEVIARFLSKSENELERMQILIANLLKLAKLDAGMIELNKSSHVLNDIVERVAESFEIRLLKEQKTFDVKSDGKISYLCDKEWMFEALSNLFKNALEHTVGGNHIRVLVEETPLLIKITVEDNGQGIHSDDINHIFKRFYRSKFSQDKQGTGIGLTLVKAIIEMHDGFISVESIMGKGTKFAIHLPKLTKL
ncbi:HAMP domain-containing sensor histidine kinase [Petroclostridium sp. X23]|uniref:sensor histidine kinase n=1 Tax=Petroclostridium sp. X23 TaxID=3045146 RepID=UPI0024ACA1F0|nr:HAMP domain-containing sensor histidine kinase [Petroclostridium sp. X23]WHH57858.1 HAMP domain-containing sensor histidine kinase [Petroclostridium sp. X23]